MGSFISRLLKLRLDIQEEIDDQTGVQGDRDIENQAVQNETAIEDKAGILLDGSISQTPISSLCLWSPKPPLTLSLASSTDSLFLLMPEYKRDMLYKSSAFWIYATTFDDHMVQSFHSVDIQNKRHRHNYVPLAAHPLDELAQSATAVFNKMLYVIGGRIDKCVYSDVFFYDPVMYKWRGASPTIIQRQGAVAATVGERIYVFGGCSNQTEPWGEVYDPRKRRWTAIPYSPMLIDALKIGLHSLLSCTVLGSKIFIRSSENGIVFDAAYSSWCPFPPNLFNHWWIGASTAAVVENMLITCYREYNEDRPGLELSIRAYDPDLDVWLMLEGFDSLFHEDAHRSNFMAVDGCLVIYHMWDKDDLRFSIIEIKERIKTSLVVNLLWRCWLPRFENERVLATPAHWTI